MTRWSDKLDAFWSQLDVDTDNAIEFEELQKFLLGEKRLLAEREEVERVKPLGGVCSGLKRVFAAFYGFLSSVTVSTILYVAFVMTTVLYLTSTLRVKDEYFLDKVGAPHSCLVLPSSFPRPSLAPPSPSLTSFPPPSSTRP